MRRADPTRFALPLLLGLALTGLAPLPVHADDAPASNAPASNAPASNAPAPDQAQLDAVRAQLNQGIADRNRLSAQAEALHQQLDSLRLRMVTVAATLQDRERAEADIESKLADLTQQEQAKSHALDAKRQQLQGVLTALQRLAFEPSEALLAMPGTPADTVRSAILLRDVTPRLGEEMAALKIDLDAVAALRADIAAQNRQLADATTALQSQRAALADLYTQAQKFEQGNLAQRQDTERRLAALAGQAGNLLDLLSKLDHDQKGQNAGRAVASLPAPSSPPHGAAPGAATQGPPSATAAVFTAARGSLLPPAEGRLAISFGQPDQYGTPAKGVTLQTLPGAQVVAPFAGKVAFAGQFRNYGLLLIIDQGEGYHTLLSGLGRIDCAVGQGLLTGEPVGVMGDDQDQSRLYMEIRHGGQPIDPLPWLSPRKTKVAG